VIIRRAHQSDAKAIGELYASLAPNIRVDEEIQVIAENGGLAVGIVRLVDEEGHLVLRGMNVRPECQRQGIGKRMLVELQGHIDERDCYCLPFSHLEDFYGTIGFERIGKDQAPDHLAKRLERYTAMGLDVIIMKRPGGSDLRGTR
jgi:N-acetylglutamate synthase-like GNAT family acetyltransferase